MFTRQLRRQQYIFPSFLPPPYIDHNTRPLPSFAFSQNNLRGGIARVKALTSRGGESCTQEIVPRQYDHGHERLCSGLFTHIMNPSIIYLRLHSGRVVHEGSHFVLRYEGNIISYVTATESGVCQSIAGSRLHVSGETSDMDSCPQEMGPCLLLLKQVCTECGSTIIPYYITLI